VLFFFGLAELHREHIPAAHIAVRADWLATRLEERWTRTIDRRPAHWRACANLLDEFLADPTGHNLRATVFVQPAAMLTRGGAFGGR